VSPIKNLADLVPVDILGLDQLLDALGLMRHRLMHRL
jgi:hypothetical protein